MAKKLTKEETKQRKSDRLAADIGRGRKKIVVNTAEPQIKQSENENSKQGK